MKKWAKTSTSKYYSCNYLVIYCNVYTIYALQKLKVDIQILETERKAFNLISLFNMLFFHIKCASACPNVKNCVDFQCMECFIRTLLIIRHCFCWVLYENIVCSRFSYVHYLRLRLTECFLQNESSQSWKLYQMDSVIVVKVW